MDNSSNLHVFVESLPSTGESWVDILSALLVPTLAVFGLYIAFCQHRINKQRLRHETYERRLQIYKIIQTFLLDILRDSKTDFTSASKFYVDTSEAAFLFDQEVSNFIDKVYEKSIKMIKNDELYTESPSVGKKRYSGEQHQEDMKWFTDEFSNLRPFFVKKISVSCP